jgi:glycosyltransferase involved in cell wall biosynthesis
MSMTYRLGILVSHPVQYLAPWFRYLSERLDIEVFYAHRQDAKGQSNAGFGVEFEWDIPLLDGYPYRWLMNVSRHPRANTFNGCDTPEIFDIVRKESFDAFLVFGWSTKSAIQTAMACWRNNLPILMRGDSHLLTQRSWLKSGLKYLPYRWFLPRIDAHLYVGKRNKAYLEHYGVPNERLFFAPHFVDNDFFRASVERAISSDQILSIRAELGIPDNAFVVLFVGKFIPKKRPKDFVLATLGRVRSSDRADIHAILVGDGPLRNELNRLAEPVSGRFHFVGFKNQTEISAYYAASDVLILPSNGAETWGLVVNEAMGCAIPAIISDVVGCAPDLIDEGRTGYTYPLGDIRRLTQRIMELEVICLRSPERFRQPLADKVVQYSIEKATEGLMDALMAVNKKASERSIESSEINVHPKS